MADVKWVKIVTDVFDDEKILLIESMPDADSLIVIWFKLLCLAGKQNNDGVFMMNNKVAYTEKMLATIFRRKEATVALALSTFEQFGMIEIIDNVITIPNWDKHQNIDGLEKIKEQTRVRVANYREKQKSLTACNVTRNATVTFGNATDKNRIDKNKKRDKAFKPPTLEEVIEYCNQRKSVVDAKKFFEYFETGNWKDAKGNQVKNWKQKLLTWENREKEKQADVRSENPYANWINAN